jgi:hypothetical protein
MYNVDMKKRPVHLSTGEWIWIPENQDHPELESNRSKKSEKQIERQIKRETRRRVREILDNIPHDCGNCKFHDYSQGQMIKREFGTCEKYKLSNRLVNRPTDPGCEHWQVKSEARRNTELKAQDNTIKKISNIKITRR